jgi:hypothetical protein
MSPPSPSTIAAIAAYRIRESCRHYAIVVLVKGAVKGGGSWPKVEVEGIGRRCAARVVPSRAAVGANLCSPSPWRWMHRCW